MVNPIQGRRIGAGGLYGFDFAEDWADWASRASDWEYSGTTKGGRMARLMKAFAALALLVGGSAKAAELRAGARNVIVYQQPGRYGGWPANHGIWSWGNEILVGFSQTYYKQRTPDHHQVDADKPEEARLARSIDGGRTWTIEAPPGLIPPEQGGKQPVALDRPMDFSQP